MAEGLAKHLWSGKVRVFSAGSSPTQVAIEAIQVMSEMGIDIRTQRSKSVEDVEIETIDLVITLCEEEVCPTISIRTQRLHWPMPDPARISKDKQEQRLDEFRKVRDQLKGRIENFIPKFNHVTSVGQG